MILIDFHLYLHKQLIGTDTENNKQVTINTETNMNKNKYNVTPFCYMKINVI